ncbi:hypothetical protein F5B22DRAFT_639774 [Xylaria bambusicola]|uniref:uncharacterized protein n=1 Tax=Xylaria bambusicola TaxID=326684 RepID=UPI0020088691|nr:uncharacterized protein F5B22DRAFT_639774 [Xylaria bambusicola]KAI0505585.1 hypothetical protein F5B22DRAFT_639774 [Xylaria bambusicola]
MPNLRSSPTSSAGSINEGVVRTYKRRPRKPISCEPCRHSKLRCDRQHPCASCIRRKCAGSCVYERRASGAGEHTTHVEHRVVPPSTPYLPQTEHGPAQSSRTVPESQGPSNVVETPEQHVVPGPTDLRERRALTHEHWEGVLQRPMNADEPSTFALDDAAPRATGICFPFHSESQLSKSHLLALLPPTQSCDYLISQFFMYMSQFFPILHGPSFQKEYVAFVMEPSAVDFSWLALLFMLLSLGLHTLDYDAGLPSELGPDRQNSNVSTRKYREAAMICLSKDQFLTRYRLTTLQALLLIVYEICHEEGVERGWTMLGIALNISIALHCNADFGQPGLSVLEVERRRRCWAGLLSLYAYQIVSYPGVDMLFLTNVKAAMPADVNDADISEDSISQPSSQPTQMSIMIFKIRLFQLSSRICRHLKGPDKFDEKTRDLFDSEIAEERRQWDTMFPMDNGVPSLLNFSSFAHWSLQFHGHHLYLLIHQPFCRPRSNPTCFRQQSRAKCIDSGAALLKLHQRFWEIPRLRPCRWTLHGLNSFYAIHGAVALASCLLEGDSHASESLQYQDIFITAVNRLEELQHRSPICKKAHPMLSQLQGLLFPEQYKWPNPASSTLLETFDTWADNLQWMNPDTVDWNFLDGVLG